MEFKDQVLYVRAVLKLTQQELAKQIGVSYATINRWELGRVNPSKMDKYAFIIFCMNNNIVFDNNVKVMKGEYHE